MKKIVVCGAGEVGHHTAEILANQGHHVTVIDLSQSSLDRLEETADVRGILGSSCHARVLADAEVSKCHLLVAATDRDEVNLLTATIGRKMGAKKVVARIHKRAFLQQRDLNYGEALEIDHIICPEQTTSFAIAQFLGNPGVMALERFAGGAIEMQQHAVDDNSQANGKALHELGLPSGTRIATIKREESAFIPDADTVLEAGDTVKIIGEAKNFENIHQLFHKHQRKTNNVVIMGGGSMALFLARDLERFHFTIRLFETDPESARDLSDKLPHVTVLQADPTDPTVFHDEQLDNSHAFVAISEDDEHNILGAVQAKTLGAGITVAVANQKKYLKVLTHLGIDQAYSPRIVAAKEVLRYFDDAAIKRLATLATNVAEVFSLTASTGGKNINQNLKDISLPKGAFVAAIQRENKVKVPGADDKISENDKLIVIGPTGIEKKLKELFIG